MFFKKNNTKISLELGHFSYKLSVLDKYNKSNYMLKDYAIIPHNHSIDLPAGIESSLDDLKSIVAVIRELLSKHKIKKGNAAVVIPDSFVFSKIISIKGPVEPVTIESTVKSKLQTILPLPIERFNISYQVVGEFNKRVLVIAEAFLIRHLYEVERVVRKLGFNPIIVDSSSFMCQNLFNDYLESTDNRNKNIAIMNMGHIDFSILLFKNGELRVNLSKKMGVASMAEEFSRKKQIPLKNALESIRENMIFLPELSPEQENIDSFKAVNEWVGELIRHIFAFFEYYLDRFHETRIDEIIFVGGGANIKNLSIFLQNHLNINIIKGTDLINITHNENSIPKEEQSVLFPAVSAAERIYSIET